MALATIAMFRVSELIAHHELTAKIVRDGSRIGGVLSGFDLFLKLSATPRWTTHRNPLLVRAHVRGERQTEETSLAVSRINHVYWCATKWRVLGKGGRTEDSNSSRRYPLSGFERRRNPERLRPSVRVWGGYGNRSRPGSC